MRVLKTISFALFFPVAVIVEAVKTRSRVWTAATGVTWLGILAFCGLIWSVGNTPEAQNNLQGTYAARTIEAIVGRTQNALPTLTASSAPATQTLVPTAVPSMTPEPLHATATLTSTVPPPQPATAQPTAVIQVPTATQPTVVFHFPAVPEPTASMQWPSAVTDRSGVIWTPAPADGLCNCNIDMDCPDFPDHLSAQQCFESCGGSASYNWSRLDRDRDGLACEGS